MSNRSIALSSSLHIIGVNAWCRSCRKATLAGLLSAVVVDVLQVESVDMTRNVAQKGQADVDEQI